MSRAQAIGTLAAHGRTLGKDPDAWIEARRSIVGGSEVVALLGGDEGFCTEWELYHRKRGTLPDVEPTEQMKLGTALEPAIIEAARTILGWDPAPWVSVNLSATRLAPGVTYTMTPRGPLLRHVSGLGGTPDGLVYVDGVLYLLEIKHASSWALRDWPGEGAELPIGYLCQVWTYLGLLGLDEARVVVLCDGALRTYTVQAHAGVFERLCEESARFWRRVTEGDEPPVDESRDAGAVLRRFRLRTPAGSVDWSGDVEKCALVESYARARDRRLTVEKFEEAKATVLRHAIGDALSIKAGRFVVNTHGNTLRVKEKQS